MKSLLTNIYSIIKPHTLPLVGVMILMLIGVGLDALAPWPFKFLIDNVLGNEVLDSHSIIGMIFSLIKNQQSIGYLVVFMFFSISITTSFIRYFESISVKRVIKSIIFEFSKIAFINMETFDMGFFRRQQVGDYIYRLSYDVSALGDYIEEGVLPLFTSVLYLILTAVIMFTISIKLALISLAVIPFLAGGLYYFNKKIVMVSKRSEFWNSTVFSFIQETLNQLKVIQAFSQEKFEAKNFEKRMGTSLLTDVKLFRLNFLLSLLVGTIIAMSYSIIIGYGITLFFNGELSTGLLIVFIFYLDNLTTPIIDIIYATTALKEARVKIDRMAEFFSRKTHTHDVGIITSMENASIEFKNVTIEGNEGELILNNVSTIIPDGKLTVIVGVSGSGKTSLISLIPRLITEPSKGEILIGGKPSGEYVLNTLRESISFVPQENVLFNETIFDIIAYGKKEATLEDVKKAAKLARANEFIEEHPHGYNFRVGEDGNYLSGGQRQRLMLARAFIKDAKIFIMDEPLSSLDIKTRAEVWGIIQEVCKNKTTVIVSNVLDVITKADQIIFMSKGKIIDVGKHTDLLKKSNLYHLMVRTD